MDYEGAVGEIRAFHSLDVSVVTDMLRRRETKCSGVRAIALESNCKNSKYIFADIFTGSSAEKHCFQATYAAFGGAKPPGFL
jgi:hypothetical protein